MHKRRRLGSGKYNGAYYYSIEICDNIIPLVDTDRNWVTINIPGACLDHSIVFIHNNLNPERYSWLKNYDDLILVCGVPETCGKVANLGTPIYLPLSIDIEYVKQFATKKTKDKAYVGRKNKKHMDGVHLPSDIDFLEGLKREELLPKMAEYKEVYAVGRTALEAVVLGCEVLPYDERFPDPSIWQPIDNREASELLQSHLRALGE